LPDLPSDVADFLSRRTSCLEWLKNRQADPAKAPDYDQVIRNLRCDEVTKDEAALRKRYDRDSHVTETLDGVWIKLVRRVRVHVDTTNAEDGDPA
jgi:hypothetical protein